MPKIIVTVGGARDEYELAAVTTIGRGSESSIPLADPVCSKEHAVIQRDAQGRFMLRDLSTLTGTFIRGERVAEPRELIDGDEIHIGETRLRFESAEATRVADPPRAEPPAPAIQALIELLADPADLKRLSAAVLDLTHATYVEIFTTSMDGKTLLPRHTAKRDHDTSRGPSLAVRGDVFAKVTADKQPVLFSDTILDARTMDTYAIMNAIFSVIVAPLVCEDTVYGVLYAHVQPPPKRFDDEHVDMSPLTASDLAVCEGMARLAAKGLHEREQNRRHVDRVLRGSLLEGIVPPAFVMMAQDGKVDPFLSHRFTEIYMLYSGRLGTSPESDAMRAVSQAALALPPIERVALGGRLLESAADSDLSAVTKMIADLLSR